MSRGPHRVLYAVLVLLFLLHNDLWLWGDPGRVLGLPVGLTYHVLFCLAVSAVMGLLARFAWPTDLDADLPPAPPDAGT